MGWSCGPLVAAITITSTTTPLLFLPMKQQQSPQEPSCAASVRSPRPTAPAPRAAVASPSPLPFLAHSPLRRGLFNTSTRGAQQLRKAAEYVFPDPIPEFADAESDKFRRHMMERLSKKDLFGSSVEEVVGICTGILGEFLHMEYGGPGTLLVVPFIDMADTINERGLPGGPQAARAAVVWAQKHVDKDWKEWTGSGNTN